MQKVNKLIYISPRDVRKNRADAVHIMLTSQAFADYGLDVELVTPTVLRDEYVVQKDQVFQLYGIDDANFTVKELPTNISEVKGSETNPKKVVLEKFRAFWSYCWKNRQSLRSSEVIIYSKCYISTVPFLLMRILGIISSPIVFETITPKNSFLHRFVYTHCDKIVSHLTFVTDEIVEYTNVSKRKIFEPQFFTQYKEIEAIKESKEELRKELGLDIGVTYVLYAGKTGAKLKQVQDFIEAASRIPSIEFLIVGANREAASALEKEKESKGAHNLQIFPFQPLTTYYKFVLASDVLIGYYPPTYHNKYHLSPGKSGIYFASGNPCIFSDLPSLRSLFPNDITYYAEPDNVDSLVSTIEYVVANKDEAAETARKAREFASESGFDKFGKDIIDFIRS